MSDHAARRPIRVPASSGQTPGVAYHEAAHAVVAEATGYGEVHHISVVQALGSHGRCGVRSMGFEFERLLLGSAEGEAYLRSHLLFAVSGPAADAVVGHDGTWAEDAEDHRTGGDVPDDLDAQGTLSDYGVAAVLSSWLSTDVDAALADGTTLVRNPRVWSAVEDVARALNESESGEMDRAAFLGAYDCHDLSDLKIADLNEAIGVARLRKLGL